jgi:hypothetical protein
MGSEIMGDDMRLNAPTKMVFLISLILAVLAVIGYFVPSVPYLHTYEFWLAIAAYVVLAAACILKGV